MRHFFILSGLLLITACATKFPTPDNAEYRSTALAVDGNTLFQHTFAAHGGQKLAQLNNVNVGITGKWKQLIRRIQPLVTDFEYRVESQERLLPQARIYASNYQGPAGQKWVYRTPEETMVSYNGAQSNDPEVLSSTALTADAFHLFLLGPLALSNWQDGYTRLSDAQYQGVAYQRIHLLREPGFGKSTIDQLVLWVDPSTKLTKLIQITLEGHSTTKGAHVEVEYLDYVKVDDYVFPSRFFERVNAPISIDAHAWQLTGIDINRSYKIDDLKGAFDNAAKAPAKRWKTNSP